MTDSLTLARLDGTGSLSIGLVRHSKDKFVAELRELEILRGDPECPQGVLLGQIEHTKKILSIIEAANRRWGWAS